MEYVLYHCCAEETLFPLQILLSSVPYPRAWPPWTISLRLTYTHFVMHFGQWEAPVRDQRWGRRTGYVLCCPCFLPMSRVDSCVGSCVGSGSYPEAPVQRCVSFLELP